MKNGETFAAGYTSIFYRTDNILYCEFEFGGEKTMMDIFSWAQVDNNLYFKAYQTCPGTFSYNIDTETLSLIDDMAQWTEAGYFGTSTVGEYVVFLPFYSTEGFLIYNIRSKEMKRVPKRFKGAQYRSFVVFENRIYMIPTGKCSLAEIAVFEACTESITYPLDNTKGYFYINAYGKAINVKESVYLTLNEYNQILKLNLKNGNYEVLSVGKREERYGVIVKAEEGFYLSGEKEFIYWWDGNNMVKEITLENRCRGNSIPWKQLFSGAVILKNHIFFSPVNYSSLIALSLEDLSVKYLYEFNRLDNVSWGLEKLSNNVFLSTVSVNGRNGRQYLVSDINNEFCVQEKEIFKVTEDMDLCRYGVEYAEFALKKYINKILKCDFKTDKIP